MPQPRTDAERSQVAESCAAKLKLSIPFVVDEVNNRVGEAYTGWPDRLYLVGKDGRIAYKGGPGPRGFDVREMSTKLAEVLAAEEKK